MIAAVVCRLATCSQSARQCGDGFDRDWRYLERGAALLYEFKRLMLELVGLGLEPLRTEDRKSGEGKTGDHDGRDSYADEQPRHSGRRVHADEEVRCRETHRRCDGTEPEEWVEGALNLDPLRASVICSNSLCQHGPSRSSRLETSADTRPFAIVIEGIH